jgi:hypothetical protein
MRKLLVSSSLACLLLTAPALADPPPPPPAPPPALAMSPVHVQLSVKAGADTRTHELVISDQGCGTVKEKSSTYEDDIRVCSRVATTGLLIETEWFTHFGQVEYRNRSETVLARKGGSSEIGRAGGIRLAIKLD